MTIPAQTFREALSRISFLAGARSLPILNTIRLEAVGSKLTIRSTNLDAHAVASLDYAGDEVKACCVPAMALMGLARTAEGDITITYPGPKLHFGCKGLAELPVLDAAEFPAYPTGPVPVGIPVLDLSECIEAVAWAADWKDKGMTRPWLGAVCIKTTAKSIMAATNNGPGCALIDKPLISAESEWLLPAQYAKEFCEALRMEGSSLLLSENHAVAQSPGFSLAVKLIDAKAPKFDAVMKQNKKPLGRIELAPLQEACKTVSFLGGDNERGPKSFLPVHIEFGDSINVAFLEPEGAYTVEIQQKTAQHPRIRLNSALLGLMLKHCPAPAMDLSLGLEHPVLFCGTGDYLAGISLCSEKGTK